MTSFAFPLFESKNFFESESEPPTPCWKAIVFWIYFFLSAHQWRWSLLFLSPWSLMSCHPSLNRSSSVCGMSFVHFVFTSCSQEFPPLSLWSLDYDVPKYDFLLFLFSLGFSELTGYVDYVFHQVWGIFSGCSKYFFSTPVSISFPSETLITHMLGQIIKSHGFLRSCLVYFILVRPYDGIISVY